MHSKALMATRERHKKAIVNKERLREFHSWRNLDED